MARDEKQTRIELINPALHERGWVEALIREERTPGGVDIIDGRPRKRKGRTDYLLCIPLVEGKSILPVALLEAKAEDKLPSLGIQQAKDYMKKFHVPVVFSTNGNLYCEYAEDTGQIKDSLRLNTFPAPSDLRQRYEKIKNIQLESEAAKPLLMPYKGGEAARYYFQDAAIRATLEKLARGDKRILLSLATGTGKTIIAVQLLYKLAQAGKLKRALFVCDRDELRTQGIAKLHAIFGDNAQIVTTQDPQRNAKVLVATYQTLNITEEFDEPKFWKENYPKNFFSHIIIDECHRSAWGKWSVILRDNPDAVHVGLTATPRIVVGGKKDSQGRKADEEVTSHNLDYFGEPVYEYSMGSGQDDGYLAACEVVRRLVDLDKKEITKEDIEKRSATDPFTGKKVNPNDIEDKYTAKDYEMKLMLDDRVKAMSEDLFQYLLDTGGPHQKTIISCARCGNSFQGCMNTATRENKKTKTKRRYYRCSARQTYDMPCENSYARAEDIEIEVYTIISVIFDQDIDDARLFNLVKNSSFSYSEDAEKQLGEAKLKLEENITKQERLSRIFTDGLLAIEAYKRQIIPLRDEEKEIKSGIRKLELSLIERERNEEYLKMIRDVVNHFQSINERMDFVSKKGLLRMLFKSIKIDNGRIKSFELFEPYKSLYEGARIKWEVQENQILMTERASVSTLLPSAVR